MLVSDLDLFPLDSVVKVSVSDLDPFPLELVVKVLVSDLDPFQSDLVDKVVADGERLVGNAPVLVLA